jgi:Flp pilus assembly protein TadG
MKPLRHQSERGNAVIEFALGWTFLWLMFAGVYEYGHAFFVYNTLQISVANAAELGSLLGYDSASPSTYTTALKNMVVYGDETSNGLSPVVPNLTTANVSVVLDSASYPQYVTIKITGYTIDALFMQIALSKPQVTVGYFGQISCSTC